jgi:transposase
VILLVACALWVHATGVGECAWSVCPLRFLIVVYEYSVVAKRYRPVDRDQLFLLPVSMADWLPEDHVVWFLIEAVARLDTTAFHRRARLGGVGRAGYDPDMVLTLLVYAMAHGTRSSRQIERLCHTDIAFRIICAGDVPDHSVLARFRQDHERALADLLTATLLLAAELGMVRLGVVALDGTKIAANAAMAANRGEDSLRRLAEQHLQAAAETDAAEDALFGQARGDEPPEDLRDRTRRGRRIQQALDEIAARKAAAEPSQAEQAAAADYVAALSAALAGEPVRVRAGQQPKAADPVRVADLRWQRARAKAQASYDAWCAKAARLGRVPLGPRALPPDDHHNVRAARAAYDTALAAATAPAADPTGDEQIKANLTDPQSRLLKTRTGFIQGYNCQTAVSDDHFIVHTDATQDTNDVAQFEPTLAAVTNLADQLTVHTARDDLTVGIILADAGYDSQHNLTLPGPDRLIAGQTRRDLHHTATTDPATGDPPPDATPRQAMNHRLRTPQGHRLYKRRSPLAEAPNSWLKDGRGLRRFTRRGLTAAHSELRLAAAVTNLLRLRALGITTNHLATA